MKKIIYIALLAVLTSCDALFEYEFQVNNLTQKDIKIIYAVHGKTDSLIIPSNETKKIYYQRKVGDKRDRYKEKVSLFDYITIDSVKVDVPTDYLQRKQWTMEWRGNKYVVYTLIVR